MIKESLTELVERTQVAERHDHVFEIHRQYETDRFFCLLSVVDCAQEQSLFNSLSESPHERKSFYNRLKIVIRRLQAIEAYRCPKDTFPVHPLV